MKRPNPLPPDQMTPAERRAELCGLLALGLVRLRMRERAKYLTILENVAYTIRPTNAVMQLQLTGETHEQARSHPRAPGRAQDHADARPEDNSGATCSTASRRRSTAATLKAAWPTASRNWPMAG